MPLRDHFRGKLEKRMSWEPFHGQWPGMIVQRLNAMLPPEYVAGPRVHLGSAFEIDVVVYENDPAEEVGPSSTGVNGGVASAAWEPARPALLLETELPTPPEYEVLVYDVRREQRLVAAVELVSPANKDRPEHRRAFVHKCEALLHKGVCVTIVDVVTIRTVNLYGELAELMGAAEPALGRSPLYAVTCRATQSLDKWRVEAWEHELTLGQPLPTLPLWLTERLSVPLDLEVGYEDTCRALRIP